MKMDQSCIQSGADEDNLNVRLMQQLKIRIGEAKNLQPKNGTNFLKDCFCVIRLDREEIFRTHCSNDKTLHPFFGEEFYFDIPKMFRVLSIYLYQRERTVNIIRNRPLGKVTICRNYLCRHISEEAWFPIVPINFESEVQGKIHLLLKTKYLFDTRILLIIVRVYECIDISEVCCDSHVVVELKYLGEVFSKKSKVKKKSMNPTYDQSFCFDIQHDSYSTLQSIQDNLLNSELRLTVVQDFCSKSNGFLGDVRIPLSKFELNSEHKAWYHLQPKKYPENEPNLGSLRLRINYISDYVFSSHFYDSLRNLLFSSTEIKPITSSVAYLLGEFVLNKADAAQPLVKIFLHYNQLVPLIRYLAEDEISKVTDVNTIFRGNSLVSKCIDELMKLVGIRYLHDTLKCHVETVILEHKVCEIDPSKIGENESIETNMNNLKHYTSMFFDAIISSMKRCPIVMREVFSVLKELAIKFFPENKGVCYYVISGFVFLRFFAPSILNPRLFDLTDKNINININRTFTLISKTIQSIGNLVVSKKNTPMIKENYMMLFYKDFITEFHIIKTKEFLESISSSNRISTKDFQEPVILKESIMCKKSRYKRIGFGTTYKKRYFCITTQHFFYAKSKNKAPLFKFPISEISVKKLPSHAYHMKNMFQVVHNKCTLHIQASNCVQERDWLDTLNSLIQLNQNTLNKVHPYDISKQLITPDLSIKLDPDRELERIHSLFVLNKKSIQTIIEACGNSDVATILKGSNATHRSQFVIEDPKSLRQTLCDLRDCVNQLEQLHKQYLTRINGSKLSPIETENF